jgi:hemimethylated DNA binding protein
MFKVGDKIIHTVFDMKAVVIRVDANVIWYRENYSEAKSTIDDQNKKYWIKDKDNE